MVIDKIHKMTVKGVKFLFNISWHFGAMEESLRGGGDSARPPAWIGLRNVLTLVVCHYFRTLT